MLDCFLKQASNRVIPILLIPQNNFSSWMEQQDALTKNWIAATHFKAEAGCVSLVPDAQGQLMRVLCGVSDLKNMWSVGNLSMTLPEGQYSLEVDASHITDLAIAWGLGAYQFVRYKKSKRKSAQLVLPRDVDHVHIENIVESTDLVRTLINLPTEDMGPSELSQAAHHLADQYQARFHEIAGDELLVKNFPAIHAVGRASDDAPRLLDLRWGNEAHPKVTLVGKGVCFDTGGLDLKPSSAMLLMKKDMGGAAHVLGLARMMMHEKLPIRLRVLIPAVENAVAGNAYRPGDVINSRKGLTIEIGNTDAEGRVVLADALTEAVSEKPDLIIDIATLTGAARVALGTELPALFCNQDALADDLVRLGREKNDPMWRLPLFSAYRDSLNSTIADINNAGLDAYAGAITAALFLKEFVPDEIPWAHFDLMAWNLKARPGRPQGGEAMALRALFGYLKARFLPKK